MDHEDFFGAILSRHTVSDSHPVVSYLKKKTAAVDRGSKARRSLGNLYALQVLAEDFCNGLEDGTQFSSLLNRMREKPFGSKLQNHPLDNRLNDEFRRMTALGAELLPVQQGSSDAGKTRKISKKLLGLEGGDPKEVASFVVDVVDSFASVITSGQEEFVSEIESIETSPEIRSFVERTLAKDSDARLFEVVSFCLLKQHFQRSTITYSINECPVIEQQLTLFKTGRTNANDGGIDFVLKPMGRFFQVTETLDFRKYFLDFDKLNRSPMTFVVKTEMSSSEVTEKIKSDSVQSRGVKLTEVYMKLFEEVFTNSELRAALDWILSDKDRTDAFRSDLVHNFKLEYGHYD